MISQFFPLSMPGEAETEEAGREFHFAKSALGGAEMVMVVPGFPCARSVLAEAGKEAADLSLGFEKPVLAEAGTAEVDLKRFYLARSVPEEAGTAGAAPNYPPSQLRQKPKSPPTTYALRSS